VLLHEFGHVFAARAFGIKTNDVTLLPIGGLASIERIPEKPSQEIAIALAGPAVNVVIAGALFLFFGLPTTSDVSALENPQFSLLQRVAVANVVLAVFNMIPAFPMDGGRVLRALLATRLGFLKATRGAAVVGQVLAVAFGFLGLFGNPLLILVALFVFLAASGEARAVEARAIARGYTAGDAMITSFERLSPASTADEAAALLLRTTQQEFPVVSPTGTFEGCVTRSLLIDALRERGGATPVGEFMRKEAPLVPRNACLENVVQMLGERQPAVGVTDGDGRLAGYITAENLSELLMLRDARADRNGTRATTSVPTTGAKRLEAGR